MLWFRNLSLRIRELLFIPLCIQRCHRELQSSTRLYTNVYALLFPNATFTNLVPFLYWSWLVECLPSTSSLVVIFSNCFVESSCVLFLAIFFYPFYMPVSIHSFRLQSCCVTSCSVLTVILR